MNEAVAASNELLTYLILVSKEALLTRVDAVNDNAEALKAFIDAVVLNIEELKALNDAVWASNEELTYLILVSNEAESVK